MEAVEEFVRRCKCNVIKKITYSDDVGKVLIIEL